MYGVASSNPDIYVHFCLYEPSTGNVFPADGLYGDVNSAAIVNSAPTAQYVLMVTYKSGSYSSDASYNLFTNYTTPFRTPFSIDKISGTLDYVMSTVGGKDKYINDKYICTIGGWKNFNVMYDSNFQPVGWLQSARKGGYIESVSGPFVYASRDHFSNSVILLYLGAGTEITVTRGERLPDNNFITDHLDVNGNETPRAMTSGDIGFVAFDYTTGEIFDLSTNLVPGDHDLIFSVKPIN